MQRVAAVAAQVIELGARDDEAVKAIIRQYRTDGMDTWATVSPDRGKEAQPDLVANTEAADGRGRATVWAFGDSSVRPACGGSRARAGHE